LCLDKHACFFVSTATSWNLSASLEISLSYEAIYQYLLDNPVSGPSFVPTVIAALYPSNTMLPYESLLSHMSIDKKINQKKIENKINIDLTILPSHDNLS